VCVSESEFRKKKTTTACFGLFDPGAPLLNQAAVEYIPNHAEGVVHQQSEGSSLHVDDLLPLLLHLDKGMKRYLEHAHDAMCC
jgi:hypothetical protein